MRERDNRPSVDKMHKDVIVTFAYQNPELMIDTLPKLNDTTNLLKNPPRFSEDIASLFKDGKEDGAWENRTRHRNAVRTKPLPKPSCHSVIIDIWSNIHAGRQHITIFSANWCMLPCLDCERDCKTQINRYAERFLLCLAPCLHDFTTKKTFSRLKSDYAVSKKLICEALSAVPDSMNPYYPHVGITHSV